MASDPMTPFRGSEAVRGGDVTWGLLAGPGFVRLDHDTYVAAACGDPLLDIRAAAVRAGPTAVVTGWSACRVLGLDVSPPGRRPVELATPDRRLSPRPGILARRRRFAADELTEHAGLIVTTPLRTAFDLACRQDRGFVTADPVVDPLAHAVAAADALARWGGFTAVDLTGLAARHRGERGVRRVPTVAALLDPRADSPPESRLRVRIVLAGLPRPTVRLEVRDADGFFRYELDLAWRRFKVAVEYDGKDHARDDRRWRDVDRHDVLRRDGWRVIVVTARQAARPRWVEDRAREALLERGWSPDPALVSQWQHIMVDPRRRP